MEQKDGTPASTEKEETTEEVHEEETTEREESESVEEYKARLQKAEELAENYKKRAEKAEKLAKSAKSSTQETSGISQTDLLFLAKTDIHDDDIEELQNLAKAGNVSLREAYGKYKPYFESRAQERTTASATHTSGGARGSKKVSGEDLLRKAERTGEVPESDDGMKALAEARFRAGR